MYSPPINKHLTSNRNITPVIRKKRWFDISFVSRFSDKLFKQLEAYFGDLFERDSVGVEVVVGGCETTGLISSFFEDRDEWLITGILISILGGVFSRI